MEFILFFVVVFIIGFWIIESQTDTFDNACGCTGTVLSVVAGLIAYSALDDIQNFFERNEMLASFSDSLVVGSVFFWLITLGLIIIVTALEENDKSIIALISVGIYIGAMEFLFHAKWFEYFATHPVHLLLGIAGYFVGGVFTVFPKWRWFLIKIYDQCEDWKIKFFNKVIEGYNYDYKSLSEEDKKAALAHEFTPKLTELWKKELEENWKDTFRGKSFPPKVYEYKEKIISWMTLWPVVLIWSVLGDLVRNIFRSIYMRISAYLQAISDKMFSKFKMDI